MKRYDELGLRLVEHPISALIREREVLPRISVIESSAELVAPVQAFACGAGGRHDDLPPTTADQEPPDDLNNVVPFPDLEWLAQEKLRLFDPRDRRGIGEQDRWLPGGTEPFEVINNMRRHELPASYGDDSPWGMLLGGMAFAVIAVGMAYISLILAYPK